MARVDSYSKRNVKVVIKEHDRTLGEYKNDVDKNRTHLNYGYGMCDDSADKVLQSAMNRCNTIMDGRKMQENTNIISEWIVTYPFTECTEETCMIEKKGELVKKQYNKPIDNKHCKDFFDTAYQFTCDRYGAENVLAGYVHMDETTPQIHIVFVPEATSRKTGKKTVSSASLLSKEELKKFHKDLEQKMSSKFGKSDYIINGRTKGNYTQSELKERKKKKRDICKIEQDLKIKEANLNEEKQNLDDELLKVRQQKEKQDERERQQDERDIQQDEREDRLNCKQAEIQAKEENVRKIQNIALQKSQAIDEVEKETLKRCTPSAYATRVLEKVIKRSKYGQAHVQAITQVKEFIDKNKDTLNEVVLKDLDIARNRRNNTLNNNYEENSVTNQYQHGLGE